MTASGLTARQNLRRSGTGGSQRRVCDQIANTARYTKMDPNRFDGFWQDETGRGASLRRAGGALGLAARFGGSSWPGGEGGCTGSPGDGDGSATAGRMAFRF
jgi:hypothetical protein